MRVVLIFLITLLLCGCGGSGGGGVSSSSGGNSGGGGVTPPPAPGTTSLSGRLVDAPLGRGPVTAFTASLQGTGLQTALQSDGSFSFPSAPPGDQVCVVADEQESAVVTVQVRPGQANSAGDLVAHPAGQVSGQVSAKRSGGLSPLPGARLSANPLVTPSEPVAQLGNARPYFAARSDERGAYRFRGLPPGDYLIRVVHPGYTEATGTVTVAAGQNTTADFVLESAGNLGSVQGQVTYQGGGRDGEPARALVLLVPDGPRPLPPVPGEPPGGAVPGSPGGPVPGSPGGGETTPPGVAEPGVSPGGSGGEAVAADPERVPISELPHDRPLPVPVPRPLFGLTDSRGQFSIEAVPPGTYQVVVVHKSGRSQSGTVQVVAGQISSLQLSVSLPSSRLEGLVTGPQGATAGAQVVAFPQDAFQPPPPGPPSGGPTPVPATATGLASFPLVRFSTRTDSSGRFNLAVEAGRYQVRASAPGLGSAPQAVDIAANQVLTLTLAMFPVEEPIPVPLGAP